MYNEKIKNNFTSYRVCYTCACNNVCNGFIPRRYIFWCDMDLSCDIKRDMLESQFQSKHNRWVIYNWHTNARFELKITDGKSINYNVVQPHQILGLTRKKSVYKLPDTDQAPKPYDSECQMGQGYVVIMFYVHGQKDFYHITIQKWLWLKENDSRKSITEEVANRVGTKYKLA